MGARWIQQRAGGAVAERKAKIFSAHRAAPSESCRSDALGFPLPIGKLFAEGELFEFTDTCAGDGVDEDEGVGELPFGEGFGKESAQLLRRGLGAFLQDDGSQWPLLPLWMRDADYAGFLDGGVTH